MPYQSAALAGRWSGAAANFGAAFLCADNVEATEPSHADKCYGIDPPYYVPQCVSLSNRPLQANMAALEVGLHHDGKQFKGNPLETEMRRRVFWCVFMLHLFNSSLQG